MSVWGNYPGEMSAGGDVRGICPGEYLAPVAATSYRRQRCQMLIPCRAVAMLSAVRIATSTLYTDFWSKRPLSHLHHRTVMCTKMFLPP